MQAKADERVMPAVDSEVFHFNKDLALLKLWYGAGDDVQNISGAACVLGYELLPCLWNSYRCRLHLLSFSVLHLLDCHVMASCAVVLAGSDTPLPLNCLSSVIQTDSRTAMMT